MRLLVFNYSMNSDSQVFSHQRTIVESLKDFYERVDVITAESFHDVPIPGVAIYSTYWEPGKRIRNLYNFYRVTLPLLLRHRGGTLFSHMTEVQSFMVSPICRILHIKHFLWYAHRSPSIYLYATYPFIDAILTSTSGSCPIEGRKVFAIGQAVKVPSISPLPDNLPPINWYTVGRVDPSKNIESCILALKVFRNSERRLVFDIYGGPSSVEYQSYYERLKVSFSGPEFRDWVRFHGPIQHKTLIDIAMKHDGFIHAFWGSLDKSLVEAIMLNRVTISINPEFNRDFLGIELSHFNPTQMLSEELGKMYEMASNQIVNQIASRRIKAINDHSLDHWINKLIEILKN